MKKVKTTQKQQILEHLKKGLTITPYESLKLFSCFRLGGVIHKLRVEGHDIKTTSVENKSGNPFARYSLESENA